MGIGIVCKGSACICFTTAYFLYKRYDKKRSGKSGRLPCDDMPSKEVMVTFIATNTDVVPETIGKANSDVSESAVEVEKEHRETITTDAEAVGVDKNVVWCPLTGS